MDGRIGMRRPAICGGLCSLKPLWSPILLLA
jgi:hypothetical protein